MAIISTYSVSLKGQKLVILSVRFKKLSRNINKKIEHEKIIINVQISLVPLSSLFSVCNQLKYYHHSFILENYIKAFEAFFT